MSRLAQDLASWCDIRVRVVESTQDPGFYFAVAVTEDVQGGRRVLTTATSRNPHKAGAFALQELAEGMLRSLEP